MDYYDKWSTSAVLDCFHVYLDVGKSKSGTLFKLVIHSKYIPF